MPTLRILTNVTVPSEQREALLSRASSAIAQMLAKPESYVMVILEDGRDLVFGGTPAPAAYLELKSLGLSENQTRGYSRALCDLLDKTLGVAAERVYIEFAAPPRQLFGWNGSTF